MKNGLLCRMVGFVLLGAALAAAPAAAKASPPIAARAGLELARAAAKAWAADAELVYVENDDDVTPEGAAARWSFLFTSQESGRARAWSVR